METYTTKKLALEKSELINREKGYRISFVTYIGKTIANMYNLNSNGWYIQNKETKSFY